APFWAASGRTNNNAGISKHRDTYRTDRDITLLLLTGHASVKDCRTVHPTLKRCQIANSDRILDAFRRAGTMQIRVHFIGIAVAMALAATSGATAQDLTITNARILDGTGRVIDRGAVVVRAGKIVSVSATAPAAGSGRTINANGKTVMPGLIDAHRHIVTGNPADWLTQRAAQQFQEFLEAGFTTVLAAIDPPQAIEARKRIEAGQLKGPRLFVGAFIPLAGPTGPPPNGDPARTDPARGPVPTTPAPAISRAATIKAVEDAVQA